MAMGLGFLGRGGKWSAVRAGLLHVAGAVLGGGGTGWLLGLIGTWFILPAWRPWVIGAMALIAVALGLRRVPPQLGRRRQVPRGWARRLPPGRLYALWGAMLGSGVVTLIPHSAFLVLLSAELTAGPIVGGLAGAAYGMAREAPALLQILYPDDPARTPRLLVVVRPVVRWGNALAAFGGGVLLVLLIWR